MSTFSTRPVKAKGSWAAGCCQAAIANPVHTRDYPPAPRALAWLGERKNHESDWYCGSVTRK
jgi:hypothetical protein